ncbi:MAG TPA: hypothetical protein VM529_02610, partial [Gemmata sp.]|nr:hypothetical protein [Gemmata sp.]
MFRPLKTRSRRGTTLIVVLALLSLLAVLGITAVYVSSDQATRAITQAQDNSAGEYPDAGAG